MKGWNTFCYYFVITIIWQAPVTFNVSSTPLSSSLSKVLKFSEIQAILNKSFFFLFFHFKDSMKCWEYKDFRIKEKWLWILNTYWYLISYHHTMMPLFTVLGTKKSQSSPSPSDPTNIIRSFKCWRKFRPLSPSYSAKVIQVFIQRQMSFYLFLIVWTMI